MSVFAPDTSGKDMASSQETQDTALLGEARSLWQQWSGLWHDRLQLAALETRQAGRSLVGMLIAGVVAGLLIVSAWLGLISAAVVWLVEIEMMTSLAILLGVMLNLLLATLLVYFIRHQSRHLGWPATIRSLRRAAPAMGNDNASQ